MEVLFLIIHHFNNKKLGILFLGVPHLNEWKKQLITDKKRSVV